jgi:hypothetical protein
MDRVARTFRGQSSKSLRRAPKVVGMMVPGGGAALRRRRGGPALSFREKRPTSDQRFHKMR